VRALRLLLLFLLGATMLAALVGMSTQASAGGLCSAASARDGYSYAGHQATSRAHGIRATVTMTREPSVRAGHVAGWVGVGGPGQGAEGVDAWIQAGIAKLPGEKPFVYAEITRGDRAPEFIRVEKGVTSRRSHALAVLEMAGRPGWWRVWVDGRAVTAPVRMRKSSRRWAPIATAESWNAGTTACNGFGFRFETIEVSYGAGGSWRAFVPGHRFLDRGASLGDLTPSIVHSRPNARALRGRALAYSFVVSSG
jgi:hypothetical protein